MAKTQNNIVDMNYALFNEQEELKQTLAYLAIKNLKRNKNKLLIEDFSLGKSMKAGMFLAVAKAISSVLKRKIKEQNVGIILPSGIAGVLVNLAINLAGKTCVNLNFTSSIEASKSSIEKAQIKTIITAKKLQEQLKNKNIEFPWTKNVIDILSLLKSISKFSIMKNLIAINIFSTDAVASIWNVEKLSNDKIASIIFTSGSESMPKGVPLTHRNIVGNILQFMDLGIFDNDIKVHANLPLFHSYGQTIQCWLVCTKSISTCCVQSPLELKQNIECIKKHKPNLIVGTPTFLKGYMKKATPTEFESLRYVIAGAEKVPEGMHQKWNEKYPKSLFSEGYGLTEATPVVSVDIPRYYDSKFVKSIKEQRKGSVGMLFAGMKACVKDPDTDEILPIGEVGILNLKGANVFNGYLDDEENTKKMLSQDGWLRTGDLACLDEDGFIYLKGRLSRFSKIAGEMVPHGLIEERITKLMNKQDEDTYSFAIASCPCPDKGEAIILITTQDVSLEEIRKLLNADGVPNLWIPKAIIKTDKIACLPTGKMDLKAIYSLAKTAKL